MGWLVGSEFCLYERRSCRYKWFVAVNMWQQYLIRDGLALLLIIAPVLAHVYI